MLRGHIHYYNVYKINMYNVLHNYKYFTYHEHDLGVEMDSLPDAP